MSQTNAANEITSITGGWVTPVYDAAGNMIFGPKSGSATTGLHNKYDAWNRLVAVYADDGDGEFEPVGPEGDTLIATYEFDGAKRRIEKTFADDAGVEYFYNQDWQMLEERFVDDEGTPTAIHQYVWSARYIDAPVIRFHDANADGDCDPSSATDGDTIRYYTGDANYNVTALLDYTGTVVERYAYTAYGEATAYDAAWSNPAAPTVDSPLYCGYFFDAETATYHIRNRQYHPGLATWLIRDLVEYEAEDFNLYRYCSSNPEMLVDPSGLGGLGDYVAWRMYLIHLAEWRECMLKYYQALMKEMVAVGDIINSSGVGGLASRDPAYANFKPGAKDCNVTLCPSGGGIATNPAGKQFPWLTHWHRLRDAINHALTYNSLLYFRFQPDSSYHYWWTNVYVIDSAVFDSGNEYGAIMLLIHEPLHDFWQFGVGHGGWGDYGLSDVVGPTNSPQGGSYYDQFFDFLINAQCGGGSIWDAIKKKVGKCNCGPKPVK